jgi:murein DD-endopeptidase MepM/ murein hydrolase activator NlpD
VTSLPPEQGTLGFAYFPPGDLERDKDRGRKNDRKVYVPNIIFPLKLGPGKFPHMNSQIFGFGGGGWSGKGAPGGSLGDSRNFDPMKQHDNYCEVRTHKMPLCPSGAGHQGQDIRPPGTKDNFWEVVAVADGIITNVTSNTTVNLKGTDGTVFMYLHMHPRSITVKIGQAVKQGQVIGKVSSYMGGKASGTSLHLHFNVQQTIKVGDTTKTVYVPTFTSLIAALRRDKELDPSIDANGDFVVDRRAEIVEGDAPTPPPGTPPAPAPVPPTPPAPTPPAPAPEPAPVPPVPPAPVPPTPEPTPVPPAPAPTPTPTPEPTPAPTPAPEPAPAPPAPAPEQPKSWWQWGKETVSGWWRKLWD